MLLAPEISVTNSSPEAVLINPVIAEQAAIVALRHVFAVEDRPYPIPDEQLLTWHHALLDSGKRFMTTTQLQAETDRRKVRITNRQKDLPVVLTGVTIEDDIEEYQAA